MISVLALGLLFGIRHAFDADHLAAVATLAVRSRSGAETVRVGLAWGLGHALTLFTVGAAVLEHCPTLWGHLTGIILSRG